MMRKQSLLFLIGISLFLSSCGPTSNLFVRDADLAKKTKKLAVLPFQDANARHSEDTLVQTNALTLKFLQHAAAELAGRYEFISQDQIMQELKKMGFEGYDPNKSMWKQAFVQTTGYTIPQAIQVGKNLGADAILLVTVAGFQKNPVFSLSVRMLDTKNGKVIVAGSAASGMGLSFTPWNAPMKKLVSRIAREVP
ncbi:MAG: hypothetical protein HYT97_03725 [Elusimicrobia bacterium]|nr:hypothetical protein [Elusimicrobiota bacterium]